MGFGGGWTGGAGTPPFTGGTVTTEINSEVDSGSDALQLETGAQVHLGGGSNDFLASDGARVLVGTGQDDLELGRLMDANDVVRLDVRTAEPTTVKSNVASGAGNIAVIVENGTGMTEGTITAFRTNGTQHLAVGADENVLRLKRTGANVITSDTSAANASDSVAAFTLAPTATLDANDLVLDIKDVVSGTSILKLDKEGDLTITGAITTGTPIAAGKPSLSSGRRVGWWNPAMGSSLPTGVGMSNAAEVASSTGSRNTFDYAVFTTRSSVGLVSGASANNYMGLSVAQQVMPDFNPKVTYLVATGASVASIRIWCVLHPATGYEATATPTTRHLGFLFDTAAGHTNWMCSSADGTTQSTSDSGVAVTANTIYSLVLNYSASGHCYFSVNGSTAVDKTANLPTGVAVPLGVQVSVTTLAAGAKTLHIAGLELEQN